MLEKYQKTLNICRKTQKYRNMAHDMEMTLVEMKANLRMIKRRNLGWGTSK